MTVAILGAGNMAKGLAKLLARAGERVVLAGRDESKAKQAALEIGSNITVASLAGAARDADVVILAVPYGAVAETIEAAGGLAGKIVIDITNPLTADFMGLTIGHSTSAAEEIQKRAPQANVVKAFNTLFAQVLDAGGLVDGKPATVFLAGDGERAVETVATLVQRIGLAVINAGPLSRSRYLEPLGGLNVALGYGQGLGTAIAPTWQRAA